MGSWPRGSPLAAATVAGTLDGEGRWATVGVKPLELEPLAAKTRPAPVLLSMAGSSKALVVGF